MRKNIIYLGLAASMLLSAACSSYKVTGVQRTRTLIDARYDKPLDSGVAAFMQPYTAEVDKLMAPVVGESALYMAAERPESTLGNLLPDILVWAGKFYNEQPDFGVYNIGGMRAAIPEGKITIGDIYALAPFENKICFVTLTGKKVKELFKQIAGRGGEGVSHEVKLVITQDLKLVSATIHDKEIDPQAKYRIATIDYVSHGNDKMYAFKGATDRNDPMEEKDLTRSIIMEYFKEKAAQGQKVESKIEGRITVE